MTLTAVLVSVSVVLTMALVVLALLHLVSTDGLGRRTSPPRSHPPDLFEPHRFA